MDRLRANRHWALCELQRDDCGLHGVGCGLADAVEVEQPEVILAAVRRERGARQTGLALIDQLVDESRVDQPAFSEVRQAARDHVGLLRFGHAAVRRRRRSP